jgi:signal transduction histidine kinase
MFQIADSLFDRGKYDSVLHYGRQALAYSQSHHYFFGETWSWVKINDALLEQNKLDEADKISSLVYQNGLLLKDSILIAIALLHKGQAQLYRDKIDSAIYYFERSLHQKLEKVLIRYTGFCYSELGVSWGRKDNEAKMTEYSLKGLSVFESLNNPYGCALTLGNLATVYGGFGKNEKAIEYSKRAITYLELTGDISKLALAHCNLCQEYLYLNIDSASKYQRLCVVYATQSGNEERMASAYGTSALVENEQGNNDKALEYERKAIQLLEASKSDQWVLASRYVFAAYYAELNKLDTNIVLSYYKKSIKLGEELKSKNNLKTSYNFLAGFYIRQKNYELALLNYRKYILYKDSLALSQQQENIAELETKYETAKKDNEIERLNTNQRINQLEIEKQKAIINGNHLVAQQKENEINLLQQQSQLQDLKLKQQEEDLLKQSLLAKNKEQELQLVQKEKQLNQTQLSNQKQLRNIIIAGSVLLLLTASIGFSRYQLKKKLQQQSAIQEMRNHIASDLHDDIGSSLSNINILNELTRRNSANPEKVNEYLSKASEDIRQVSEGISDIVWNINPRYDNLEHLFIRMKRYASDILDGKNINYTMDFPGNPGEAKLGMDKRRDLYLIFKEAVNNLAKYSHASDAIINLSIDPDSIKMVIQDNGKGFDTNQVKIGNGLQNMKRRVSFLNGSLDIQTKSGAGTRLELEIPV